jgi:septal ring factor EnvC (AmiA/AmiB activator)
VKLCVEDLIDNGVDVSKRKEFEESLRKQVTEIKKIQDLSLEKKQYKERTNIYLEENDKEIKKMNIEENSNVGEDNKATPNKKNTHFRKKKEAFATEDDKASAEDVSNLFGHMKRRSGN